MASGVISAAAADAGDRRFEFFLAYHPISFVAHSLLTAL